MSDGEAVSYEMQPLMTMIIIKHHAQVSVHNNSETMGQGHTAPGQSFQHQVRGEMRRNLPIHGRLFVQRTHLER